jgi:hypothetical protein
VQRSALAVICGRNMLRLRAEITLQSADPDSSRRSSLWTRRVWSIVALAVALGIIVGAIFSGALLSASSSPQSPGPALKNQGISISGVETIKVLGANGGVISSRSFPDPLTPEAIASMIACIIGPESGSPWIISNGAGGYVASCSGWIQSGVFDVFWNCAIVGYQTINGVDLPTSRCNDPASQTVTNTPTPVGCSGVACTGWITQAAFTPATYCSGCGLDAVVLGDASLSFSSASGLFGPLPSGNALDCIADSAGVGVCSNMLGVGSPWPSAQSGSLTGSTFSGSAVTLVVSISFTVT